MIEGARRAVAAVSLATGCLLVALVLSACSSSPSATTGPPVGHESGRVLLVGAYHGVAGAFHTIQSAVDAAHPGDWILIAPGDYHEGAGSSDGVKITTPDLHLRGMDRNGVVVDGDLSGSPRRCNPEARYQDFGPSEGASTTGRNGIVVLKANDVSVENLTVCNFVGSSQGNEIWFNGGDGSGQIGLGSYYGGYLTATSTFVGPNGANMAQYGLFVSNASGPGRIVHSFGSNMADAAYYVGACPDCNVILDQDVGTHSALGFSGTNSGGNLLLEGSVFTDNTTGIAPNSLNNDDAPPPQNGACLAGRTGPTGTHSCYVIRGNIVRANNDPDVPGGQGQANGGGYSVVGTGIILSGSQNDTVIANSVTEQGAWGIVTLDFPWLGPSTSPGSQCQGGVATSVAGQPVCIFPATGNEIADNTLSGNGFFGNPSNGDLADATATRDPGNCWHGNRDLGNHGVTSTPASIQSTHARCGSASTGAIVGPLGVQLACASALIQPCHGSAASTVGIVALLVSQGLHESASPVEQASVASMPVNYPTAMRTTAPMPGPQPTMADPCTGVPADPWCP